LLGAVLLYLFQRDMLYHQTPEYQHDLQVISVDSENEKIKVLLLNPNQNRAIVYFGGNAEAVIFNQEPFSKAFPIHTIYLVNYRGYGGSSGNPTEANLYADALSVYDAVAANHKSISVLGRSLGSGVATYLAANRTVDALALITPYDSIQAVAQSRFPIYPSSLLLKDKYDSISRANTIAAKTLIIAAELDQIIPLKHAEKLRDAFKQEQVSMTVIQGANHNNLSVEKEYFETLQRFLMQ